MIRLSRPVSRTEIPMDQSDVYGGHSSYFYSPYNYPTALVIAQHNQQSTSVEAGHVTVNTTGTSFAGKLRHGRDTSGRTLPIRVINPDKRSEYKTYTLRNLSSQSFEDLNHLKREITSQLGDKVSSDPDCGYCKGQTRLWIRDDADVKHVGRIFSQGNTCTLWCDAVSLIPKKRKPRMDSAESSDEEFDSESKGKSKKKRKSALEERKEHVEEVKSELLYVRSMGTVTPHFSTPFGLK